jgi:hypothetical protein
MLLRTAVCSRCVLAFAATFHTAAAATEIKPTEWKLADDPIIFHSHIL